MIKGSYLCILSVLWQDDDDRGGQREQRRAHGTYLKERVAESVLWMKIAH